MNENSDLLPNLLHEDFEMQMRGYSRRQVDDFVARQNAEIRELEQRLARALDESEQLRRELSTVRQQSLVGKPAHQEVSERIAQILKLADDEARAQRNKADDEIAKLRTDAQQETDRIRADARDQAERMLTAAQEQAERTIGAARTEADKTRTTARTESDRLTSETRKKADAAMTSAKAQSKKVLDEATARATAIHDGAERRLNLLSTRHAETVRRLEDILDGVQGLVAAEAARMSLEEEVAESVSKAIALAEAAESAETDRKAPEPDLARLAPPTPNMIPNGTVAPPGTGGDSLLPPVRPGAASRSGTALGDSALIRPGSAPNAGPASSVGYGSPADAGPLPVGRPGGVGAPGVGGPGVGGPGGVGGMGVGAQPAPPPMPPMPPRSPRLDAPAPEGAPRPPLSMPSGSPRPGHGPAMPGSSPAMPGLSQSGPPQPVSERDDGPQQERETKRDDGRPGTIDPDEPTEGIRLMR
jgi:cell division septum initiation protein DivIVA